MPKRKKQPENLSGCFDRVWVAASGSLKPQWGMARGVCSGDGSSLKGFQAA